MRRTLATVAAAAALLLPATAAQASPEYPTQAECEAAGYIWAGDFCYTRQANNPEWLPTPAPEPTYQEAVPSPTPAPQPSQAPAPPAPAVEAPAAPAAPAAVTPAPAPVQRTELAYTGPRETMLAWLAVAGAGLVIVGGLSKYLARRRQAHWDARENARWLAERYAEEQARANGVPVLEQGTAQHPLARVRQAEAYKELP